MTDWVSLQSKGLSRVLSNSTVQKQQFFSTQPSLWSSPHIHTCLLEKRIALTIWTFVSKVMSLLFNMLSRFVIAFLPRSKSLLNFMAAVLICSDFEAQESKICHCFLFFPFYLPWSDGTRCHDLSFLNVDFKPAFSVFSFILIKRLFSSSSLSHIRIVSSAFLKLLIFLPAILIPTCDSSNPAFHRMYSACKLNKPGESIQAWHTPFSIWTSPLFHG